MTFIVHYICIGLIYAVVTYFVASLELEDNSREFNELSMLWQTIGYFIVVILWPVGLLYAIYAIISMIKIRRS